MGVDIFSPYYYFSYTFCDVDRVIRQLLLRIISSCYKKTTILLPTTIKMTLKTTNPKDFIELLGVFGIALTNNLLDKNEVIKWADDIITNDSEPDYFIIELSLCGHKNLNDIVSLLNTYIGEEKPQISYRVILGFLYRQYVARQITLKKVLSTVDWIVWKANLTNEEKSFMYGLDEEFYCAEEGIYGTVKDIEDKTLRFLEIYKDFEINSYKKWNTIDATIENKIKFLNL